MKTFLFNHHQASMGVEQVNFSEPSKQPSLCYTGIKDPEIKAALTGGVCMPESAESITSNQKIETLLDKYKHANVRQALDSISDQDLKEMLSIGLSQLDINEQNGSADKYFPKGLKTKETAWCTAFVNWTLHQGGFNTTNDLLAKTFLNFPEGNTRLNGHIGFKIGNRLLGGNQHDKVSLEAINKPILGWLMPQDVGTENIHLSTKEYISKEHIPDGAILVFDRSPKKDRNMT